MNIGNVIKKYRKEIGITQEEMASRLGVTTPAVNKWENGNSNPDIELLAPIARLLHISLDTLLSFHETLTGVEIEELIREMDKMFSEEGYEKTYEWALNIVKEYPNCNILIWQVALMLDARRMTGECKEPDKYDDQINSWYERALNDENEEIRHHAADSLFGFYLRKQNYPMAEKNGTLSAVFDMGKYNEYAPMLDIVCAQKDVEGTYQVVEQLLESVDSLYGFSKSKLYRHKKFKDTDGSYLQVIKEKLLEGFRNEEDLSFMKGYEPWEKLLSK